MNCRIEAERERIRTLCRETAFKLYGLCPAFSVSRPRDGRNGDFASSAALALGGTLKRRPSEIAAELAENISLSDGERVEPGGKGFLNFYLRPDFLLGLLEPVRELPYVPLPELGSPEFELIYPYHRLRRILELRGHRPTGRQNLSLLTSPYEVRLLWAIADENCGELAAAAMDFYDRLDPGPDLEPLAEARYILLNNALYRLYGTGKEIS